MRPSERPCQNCGHTFHQLGCTYSGAPFFWCPSCGSIRTCEGDEHRPGHTPRVVKVGVLVAAGLHSAFEMIADRHLSADETAERILVVPVEKSVEAKGRELWGKLVASDQYPPYHPEEK